MQRSNKFDSVYVQADALNCPADMEALLAGAGYNVKAADVELVVQRLEHLDFLFASQDGGDLSLSHLSSEAVHYNPSDMASWLDCMIEEIGPSSSSSSALLGASSSSSSALLGAQDAGGVLRSVEGTGFLPQARLHYALQEPSPMLFQHEASLPSISQLIKDAIGHNGASSSAFRSGLMGCHGAPALKEAGDLQQQYKMEDDQVSSNRAGVLYGCSAGDRSTQSPPYPQMRQVYVAPAPAPASSQSSNNRGPYQESPVSLSPQYRLLQSQDDLRLLDANARAASVSPTSSSPTPCQEHSSPRVKDFHMQQAPDDPPNRQTLPRRSHMDINDDCGTQELGIKLVHLLMASAEAIHNTDLAAAVNMVREIKRVASSTSGAISKVACHFAEALARRINPGRRREEWAYLSQVDDISELLYNNFYEVCPYLKFAHFTANQAILEAFQGHKFVHVIDFNLMQGLQWPALIQALAIRPGGPPHLRMTGIGLPHPDSKDVLQEVGMKLAQLAGSVNIEFSFRGMVATKLDDVKPWYFEVKPGEAVAVNSIFQLHRLIHGQGCSDPFRGPIDEVLSSIKSLKPKVVTVVEQEANHNSDVFLRRFVEALQYYSTMFDSLEACLLHPQCSEMACTEMYLSREIANIVACEGLDRVERHEPLLQWQKRMLNAGFRPLHLGSNAFEQGSMLLKYFSGEGYTMEENKGCITLGWHSRPLIAASAWQCG